MGEAREVREINRRQFDGLEVILWWVKDTLDTYVEVTDTKHGYENFIVDTPIGVKPHEVFEHPMYWRSVQEGNMDGRPA